MSSKSVIEGRKKISEKMKAIWSNPEYKERLREKRKLYLRNPENKKKLVDSINSWVHTKEHADNVSIQTKKRWIEDDGTWRKKNTEALNKKNSDINHKKKMSIVSSNNMKKLWDTKEFRDKMQKTILTTFADGKFKSCNTKIELTTKSYLDELDVEYIGQYNFDNRFSCDFAIVDLKIIIECDGEYWHSLPNVIIKDKYKDEYIRRAGWRMLRLPERIIKNKAECIRQIRKVIEVPIEE